MGTGRELDRLVYKAMKGTEPIKELCGYDWVHNELVVFDKETPEELVEIIRIDEYEDTRWDYFDWVDSGEGGLVQKYSTNLVSAYTFARDILYRVNEKYPDADFPASFELHTRTDSNGGVFAVFRIGGYLPGKKFFDAQQWVKETTHASTATAICIAGLEALRELGITKE